MSAKLPSHTTIGTVLAFIGALFIGYVGVSYLLAPQSMAPNFGLPSWPHGEGAGFLAVKGARDLASGLVILTVLVRGNRRVLGWVMLATAVTPIGDMLIVLLSGGEPATAFGVHGATAAAVILAGALLLSGSRARSPQPVA
ncbi:small membrane hydrophobic protein [[Actinomadura] parvosata subsp. kistnae]|uniref:Small membrane hydrophobic protein n=1 Tax=[Actinomadura] parvosata subsp. kistnae TaxID=1909395 RepID=A0A1U9ZXA1_9ACTN|nr:DUF4267 domain-containing protein [Nonomuraea sp. ATCC 55076]AQZ62567.1 hypothetical protein BKM31_14855 [Nonomuraea sp. ATCC 55076]SPL88841.1 small membrane hydrophobic protein [Actinomadura parvosata subsp. kistnae]